MCQRQHSALSLESSQRISFIMFASRGSINREFRCIRFSTKLHLPYLSMVLSRLSDAFQMWMDGNSYSFRINAYLHYTSEYLPNVHRSFQKSRPPGNAPRYHDQETYWSCSYGGWILKTQKRFIDKVHVSEDDSLD